MASYCLNKYSINLYYQNTRGLRTKCLELYNNILCNDYDLLLFTETWLQADILSTELCDNRYDIHRNDLDLHATNKKSGGGVMLCSKKELNAVPRPEWSVNNNTESLYITIPARAVNSRVDLHVVVVYIAPDINLLPSHIQNINCSLQLLANLYPTNNILCIGDFNLPFVTCNNSSNYNISKSAPRIVLDSATTFLDDLNYLGLNQYNHILNSKGNTLDLCFCNLLLSINKYTDPLVREDLYHPTLIINLLDMNISPLRESHLPRFNFFKCNYSNINSFLEDQNWTKILKPFSVDEALDIFYEILNKCFLLHVPLIKPSCASHYPVWYSTALIKIIKEKNKMHKKWKKFRNPLDYDEFSLLRARQHRIQKQCFNNFTDSAGKIIKNNPRYFWKYVKSKRGGSNYPNVLKRGNTNFSDGPSICSAFNDFFKKRVCYSYSVETHLCS
ncbi:unnamed protein product [Euphydryas editha]|uniref:Endonuclease/exonuclease/phosphatase domain-containing protein n=1 Tax=Euphydryas editha TaxID=104508 RepID=A0AAU9V6R8_EUPED|nr:unnamed protein product [Euphydryas editha]